jgi:RNA-directed DNA polymerase
MIREWLRAGVIESGEFTPTDEGSPQGGVISPLLMNVALHGMEQAAGVRYRNSVRSDVETVAGCPVLVRYADDYVAMCHTREQAEKVKADLADWLKPRGLAFNEDKTRVIHVKDGFSFLGFDIRRHIDRQGSAKLLIKPSKESVKRLRKRLAADARALHGANAAAVVSRLNPVVRGWSAYYRSVVSGQVFNGLDHDVWLITYRWARRSHSNKSRGWVTARYFGPFNKSRRDRWVFGDRDTGAYLAKFAWTKIVRHVPVRGRASPDDPALAEYWVDRRRKHQATPADERTTRLLRAQGGRCHSCGEFLLYSDHEPRSPFEWEQWFVTVRRVVRKQHIVERADGQDRTIYRLLHVRCHQRLTTAPAAHQQ